MSYRLTVEYTHAISFKQTLLGIGVGVYGYILGLFILSKAGETDASLAGGLGGGVMGMFMGCYLSPVYRLIDIKKADVKRRMLDGSENSDSYSINNESYGVLVLERMALDLAESILAYFSTSILGPLAGNLILSLPNRSPSARNQLEANAIGGGVIIFGYYLTAKVLPVLAYHTYREYGCTQQMFRSYSSTYSRTDEETSSPYSSSSSSSSYS